MPHIDTENYCLSSRHVVQIRVHNQPVTRWHYDRFFKIFAIVLDLIEPDSAEVHVCEHSVGADRELTALDGLT